MLIKKIKRFHLSKSRNFDLLNYENGLQIIKKDDKYYPEIYLDEALYVQYIYKMNKTKELKINSTLWAYSFKIS